MDVRQLILIRQFFNDARYASAAETPFLRLKRTLHLDLCVELALYAIVREFGTPEEHSRQGAQRDPQWHQLWDLADGVAGRRLSKNLPERSALKLLHDQRNLAQHRGAAPSAEQVHAAVEPVRTLLEFSCRELFDLDFERLREWHVLQHDQLRAWFDDCAEALERSEPFLAAAACKLLYKRVIACVRHAALGADGAFYAAGSAGLPYELRQVAQSIVEPLQEGLTALEAEIVAISLGLPIAHHYRFSRTERRVVVHEFGDGNWDPVNTGRWPSDPDEARTESEYMLDYLSKACVLLESAFPGVFADLKTGRRLRESRAWQRRFASPSPAPTPQ